MRKLNMICLFFFVLFSMVSVSYSACEGDLNCDGDVDGSDLADFAADYGRSDCPDCIAAPVPKTGQNKCFDEDGSEINCAGTGQDGEYQKGVPWPDPRFKDNGDGTVTDNLTGLTWLKNNNCFGAKVWSDALASCNSLADGQCELSDDSISGDWRLPNVRELHSLIDFGNYYPALPSGHPFTGPFNYTWSSTTDAYSSDKAWAVLMQLGHVVSYDKNFDYLLWPVRGGN
jgi:hypothetical protein